LRKEKHDLTRIRRLRLVLFCAILGVVLLAIHLGLFIYPSNDAYIHFRIAEHLLDGNGPYFNSSDPVKSSTSTVWTLAVTSIFFLMGRSTVWVACLNAMLLTLGGILFGRLVYEVTGIRATFWLTCLLYVSTSLRASVGLMEIPLCLFLTASGLLLLRHRQAYGFAFLAMAVFCRPEISLCLFTYLAYFFSRKEISLPRIILWTCLGALPFFLFDFYFFGTVIPQAIRAKAAVYATGPYDTLKGFVVAALPDRLVTLRLPSALQWTGLFAILGLAAIAWARTGLSMKATMGPAYLLPLTLSGLSLGILYVASATHLHLWYVPLVVSSIVVSIVPVMAKKQTASITLAFVTSLVFGISLVQGLAASAISPILWPDFETGARVRKYLEVGKWLCRQYPDANLLTSEIGGLGYSFKGTITDACDLASPQALRYHPMKVPEERSSGEIGAIPVGLVAQIRPELIVTYDAFGEALLRRPEIMSQYKHLVTSFYIAEDMARWETKRFRYGGYLHILIRKDMKAIESPSKAGRRA
jgi:hypothetical protein